MAFETIRTERLQLRVPRMDDLDALVVRRNEPEVATLQSWETPYPESAARSVLEDSIAMGGPASDEWWMLTIASPDDTEIYGDLALKLEWDGRAAEVGYSLAKQHWGNGFGSEALHRLLEWLFEVQKVTRVHASLHPDNIRSAMLLERCGFVFEGHTKNSFWVGDENSDDWNYGLTPELWQAWRDRPTSDPVNVELREIDPQMIRPLGRLAVHHSQERFVSPVVVSLAQAGFPPVYRTVPEVPWPRMVIADDELVGFVMVALANSESPEPYLWRLLIDRHHQRRGIGRRILDAVTAQARTWGATALNVSYVEGIGSPKPLYTAYGFVPTGEYEDGEAIARLEL